MSNPIDSLINQIDDDISVNIKSCIKCHDHAGHLYEMSCSHCLCQNCTTTQIANKKIKTCPSCHVTLTKDLNTLVTEHKSALKVTKLADEYGMDIGDTLWLYGGNSGNWLYSEHICNQLNLAYETFNFATANQSDSDSESDDNIANHQIEIQINTVPYIVDFKNRIQYQKNNSSKHRSISWFKFKSASDLKKYNIVGVAGKPL